MGRTSSPAHAGMHPPAHMPGAQTRFAGEAQAEQGPEKKRRRKSGSMRKTRGMVAERERGARTFRDWLQEARVFSLRGRGEDGRARGGAPWCALGEACCGEKGVGNVIGGGCSLSSGPGLFVGWTCSHAFPADRPPQRDTLPFSPCLPTPWHAMHGPGRGPGSWAVAGMRAVECRRGADPRARPPDPQADLERAPAPNYLTAAAGPPRVAAQRHYCSVCGDAGRYSCTRCGSRFCSRRCNTTHTETRCLKFTL